MAFTTQIIYTISGTGDRTHAYGTIDTFDSTTISDSDVLVVTLNGNTLTLTTDYTVDDGTNKNVILDPGLTIANLDTLVIARATDIDDTVVTYTDNTLVVAGEANLSNKQFLFKLQELDVKTDNSVTLDLAVNFWDGQGFSTFNFGPAVQPTGLTTLAQVQDMLAGVSTATINNTTDFTFAGTGSQTSFTLNNAPQGLVDAKELIVYVNNVPQVPGVGYGLDTTGATPAITFTVAPANLDVIYVRAFSGTVSTTFGDRSVTGSAIALDTINVEHINVGTGAADRFMIFDASGDPTAIVATHSHISNFAAGVALTSLNDLTAADGNYSMGTSYKLTDLVAGTTGTADSCTVAQMENHVASSGGVAVSATTSISPTAGVALTNGSAKSAFIVATNTVSTSMSVFLEMDHIGSPGTFTLIGKAVGFGGADQASISFFVPSGAQYRFDGVAPGIAFTQTF